jgi:hypothetical protein
MLFCSRRPSTWSSLNTAYDLLKAIKVQEISAFLSCFCFSYAFHTYSPCKFQYFTDVFRHWTSDCHCHVVWKRAQQVRLSFFLSFFIIFLELFFVQKVWEIEGLKRGTCLCYECLLHVWAVIDGLKPLEVSLWLLRMKSVRNDRKYSLSFPTIFFLSETILTTNTLLLNRTNIERIYDSWFTIEKVITPLCHP